MSLVKAKDTKPELRVRHLIYSLGYRYRLHGVGLPGKPDIVFKGRKKAIFIHGCFWHRHEGCALARLPKSRRDFWVSKLEGNKKRDIESQKKLDAMGWRFLVVWECELQDEAKLISRLIDFLDKELE